MSRPATTRPYTCIGGVPWHWRRVWVDGGGHSNHLVAQTFWKATEYGIPPSLVKIVP